jgi:hypothetical protein
VNIQDGNAFIPGNPSIALIQPDEREVVPLSEIRIEIGSGVL